jgi:predicted O-methyltransferase YrrM
MRAFRPWCAVLLVGTSSQGGDLCPSTGTTHDRGTGFPVWRRPRVPSVPYAGWTVDTREVLDIAGIAGTDGALTAGSALAASMAFAESFVAEDAVLAAARARASEVGCVPIGPGGGAVLRLLAAALGARSVVELGTGTGVSGVWLLRGMRPEGVLTSIDVESEHQRLARKTFTDAGFASSRFRLINGRALDVLPRLADTSYDLVLVDADKTEYADYLSAALRLLRPGGVIAMDNVLWKGRVADPAARDPESVALREVAKQVRDHEMLVPALLPVGDGLLVGVKQG